MNIERPPPTSVCVTNALAEAANTSSDPASNPGTDNGTVIQGEEVLLMKRNGDRKPYKITRIFTYDGISRVSVPEAVAGDIVSLAGIEDIDLGETVADIDQQGPTATANVTATAANGAVASQSIQFISGPSPTGWQISKDSALALLSSV